MKPPFLHDEKDAKGEKIFNEKRKDKHIHQYALIAQNRIERRSVITGGLKMANFSLVHQYWYERFFLNRTII